MDLMLAFTEDGIHDVMWSDDLLDEWERVIVRERRRSPDAAAAITATIRQFFADTRIPAESYQGLIAEVDGPDPDDNLHMAAAVAGQVESLITWNGKDFDCGFIRKHAIRIVDPDEHLCALYEDFPDEVLATVTRLAASKRRPPMAAVDVVSALERAGAGPATARRAPGLRRNHAERSAPARATHVPPDLADDHGLSTGLIC
jgi:predicted nucleic acid-binding protein